MRFKTAFMALLVSALIASACSSNSADTVADGSEAGFGAVDAGEDVSGDKEPGESEKKETLAIGEDSEEVGSTGEDIADQSAEASAGEETAATDGETGEASQSGSSSASGQATDSATTSTKHSSKKNATGKKGGSGSPTIVVGGGDEESANDGLQVDPADGGQIPSSTTPPTTSAPGDTQAPTTAAPTTQAPGDTQAPTTVAPTTQAPTTAAPTTQAPQPTPAPPSPGNLSLAFSEDFTDASWRNRIDTGLFHRDDNLVSQTQWPGDHASTGPNDLCGPPTEKRTVLRGERDSGFNNDWIYRCVPGGDLNKAHLMTTIGDTSGYSLGGFAPKGTFNNVREVRWDVNQTDLGDRQWTEIAIIPADRFNILRLPCTLDVPCDTVTHDVLGSVGTQWSGLRARRINTPEEPGGFTQAGGSLGYRCGDCPYSPAIRFGAGYGAGDPALTSLPIRRSNYFRDNGNGTLTWGFQLADGSFNEFTAPGSFPNGAVRVVFKDHNYTPMKSPATLLGETTFTWHWDNIQVYTG